MISPQISGLELFSGAGPGSSGGSQALVPATDATSSESLEVTPGEGFGWFLALVNGAMPAATALRGKPGAQFSAPLSQMPAQLSGQGQQPLVTGDLVPGNGKGLPPGDVGLTEMLVTGQSLGDRTDGAARTAAALSFIAESVADPRSNRLLTLESRQSELPLVQESEEGVLLDFKTGTNTALTRNALVPAPLPSSPAQQGDFDRVVGQRLMLMIQNGSQDARLKVHPASLGSVEIQLSLDGDEARVSLSSPHSSVRDALDLAVPRLREILGEAGVSLGQVDVGSGDSASAENAAGQSQAAQSRTAEQASEQPDTGENGQGAVRHVTGLVDTFA